MYHRNNHSHLPAYGQPPCPPSYAAQSTSFPAPTYISHQHPMDVLVGVPMPNYFPYPYPSTVMPMPMMSAMPMPMSIPMSMPMPMPMPPQPQQVQSMLKKSAEPYFPQHPQSHYCGAAPVPVPSQQAAKGNGSSSDDVCADGAANNKTRRRGHRTPSGYDGLFFTAASVATLHDYHVNAIKKDQRKGKEDLNDTSSTVDTRSMSSATSSARLGPKPDAVQVISAITIPNSMPTPLTVVSMGMFSAGSVGYVVTPSTLTTGRNYTQGCFPETLPTCEGEGQGHDFHETPLKPVATAKTAAEHITSTQVAIQDSQDKEHISSSKRRRMRRILLETNILLQRHVDSIIEDSDEGQSANAKVDS